jgi:hypothetical protein
MREEVIKSMLKFGTRFLGSSTCSWSTAAL